MQQVIDLAYGSAESAVVGRSLTSLCVRASCRCSRPGNLVDLGAARDLPRHMWSSHGRQQRMPRRRLRIAMDAHKQVSLAPGDTVVLSSRIIPGNERAISSLVNHLYRRGAHVHYGRLSRVHVSGHASQEELKLVLNLVRPRHFVPVHGEHRHLVRHVALATEWGSPRALSPLEEGRARARCGRRRRKRRADHLGAIFVDGKGIGDVEDVVLRDRRHLSEDGLVLAVSP